MSVIIQQATSPTRKCFFCGAEKCSAKWLGMDGEISICRRCAIQSLPAFIADATFMPDSPLLFAETALAKIKIAFLRAIAVQVERNLADTVTKLPRTSSTVKVGK